MLHKIRTRKKLSREERRDLEIEISFLAGLLRRDRTNLDALRALADDFAECGRYADTLKLDKRLARLKPKDPRTLYNLACGYALTSQWTEAANSLCRAVDCGYRDAAWLMKDPDLTKLRRQKIFKLVLARLSVTSLSAVPQ